MGWVFMAFIILAEAFLMTRYLTSLRFNKKIYLSAAVSNVVSGAVGITASMALNGGWWLVVWFPWVSSNEVDIHSPQQVWGLVIYYVVALILSVLIELLVNWLMLRKQHPFKGILRATLLANAASYALGAILIIMLCLL